MNESRLKNVAITGLFFALFFVGDRPAFPQNDDKTPAKTAESALAAYIPSLRTSLHDLRVPAGRIPALSMPQIEKFFDAPLSLFTYSESKTTELEKALLLSDKFEIVSAFFDHDSSTNVASGASARIPAFPVAMPGSLKPMLSDLYRDLVNAQSFLDRAVNSVPPQERKDYLRVLQNPPISSRETQKIYDDMKQFDDAALLDAGRWLVKGVELIQIDISTTVAVDKPIIWETPLGKFRIQGAGDDTVSGADLKDTCVLIDLGGRNSYSGSIAAAKDGQIRLVVDFGTDVTTYSSEADVPNAGSGLFGLGALVFPNAEGLKRVVSPSFSQGCGIGGIGLLLSAGPVQMDGRRFVQGVGSFGVGFLETTDGFRSTYNAHRSAQGLGLTRGVGIFLHRGDGAEIHGGLVEPDPREPLATISLCQGVGYGPRGYTGGGIGIASLQGSSLTVMGSYFAQGTGYWHGLGIFHLKGNDSTIQARRYDQGTGVHSAFGHFSLEGNRNTVLNWGVGPAYGWDRAVGSALITGDANRFQADWGAAQGSVGGLSLSYWKGSKNILSMNQFGTGSFFRDDMGRSLHVIDGANNRLKYAVSSGTGAYSVQLDPWAWIQLNGGRLDSQIKPIPVSSPSFPRLEATTEELDMPSLLTKAEKQPIHEQLEELVDLAAAFSLNKNVPRTALEEILRTSTENVTGLVDFLNPAAVDQLIQLRIILSAFGPEAGTAVLQALPQAPDDRKGFLLNFVDAAPAAQVIPTLQKLIDADSDARQKSRALFVLGRLFDLDTGTEPGQRAALRSVVRYLRSKEKSTLRTETNSLLSRLFVSDGFGLIAKTLGFDSQSRVEFLKSMPPDLTETIGPVGAQAIFDRIDRNNHGSLSALETELNVLEGFEPQVRQSILNQLTGTPEVTVGAIVALGKIGNPLDAAKIGPLLVSTDPRIREAATTALGRLGPAGLEELKNSFRTVDSLTKKVILAAVPLSTTDQVYTLVEMGLADPDPTVRLSAVASLTHLSPAAEKDRSRLVKIAKDKSKGEKDASVRLALLAACK